jgi:hypothetical protein
MNEMDTFPIDCACGTRLMAAVKDIGRKAACPKCRAMITIEHIEKPIAIRKIDESRPVEPPPVTKPAYEPQAFWPRTGRRNFAWLLQRPISTKVVVTVGIVSLIWWLGGMRQEPGPWVFAHYISLGLACWCLCETIRRCCFNRTYRRALYLLPVAAALLTYGNFDGYEDMWIKVDQGWDKPALEIKGHVPLDSDLMQFERTEFRDYRWRWSGSIYWRDIAGYRKTKFLPDWDTKGPMTATNRPHGHWITQTGIFGEPNEFKIINIWYWYGEEISEGEWHLRTK